MEYWKEVLAGAVYLGHISYGQGYHYDEVFRLGFLDTDLRSLIPYGYSFYTFEATKSTRMLVKMQIPGSHLEILI